MSDAISQILMSLRAERAPNDRRRNPRVGFRARVSVYVPGCDGETQVGWIRDLSSGGAGLLLPRRLRADEEVVIYLDGLNDCASRMRCRVVHCAPAGSCFRVGVQFAHQPAQPPSVPDSPADDLEALRNYLQHLTEAVVE